MSFHLVLFTISVLSSHSLTPSSAFPFHVSFLFVVYPPLFSSPFKHQFTYFFFFSPLLFCVLTFALLFHSQVSFLWIFLSLFLHLFPLSLVLYFSFCICLIISLAFSSFHSLFSFSPIFFALQCSLAILMIFLLSFSDLFFFSFFSFQLYISSFFSVHPPPPTHIMHTILAPLQLFFLLSTHVFFTLQCSLAILSPPNPPPPLFHPLH